MSNDADPPPEETVVGDLQRVPLATRSDASLLRAREQRGEAFAEVYRRHAEPVVRFVASRGVNAHEAADLVSETFFAALRQRDDYRPDHPSARLWLLGIASNKLADRARRSRRDSRRHERLVNEAVLSEGDLDGYSALVQTEMPVAMSVLGDLPLAEQHAIRARVIEDRTYADIAAELGLSEAATRQRVSRGLASLRERFGRTS
jgi:RNA polymerase sigma factor (sigma-70 family)